MERVRAVFGLINEAGILVVFHDEALLPEIALRSDIPPEAGELRSDG